MEPVTEQQAAPVKRLYRHALESVFKFCGPKDLHALLTVNHGWSSAVSSTQRVGLRVKATSFALLSLIARSRLAHHVTQISGDYAYTSAGLQILADRMPWIEHFVFDLPTFGDVDCAEEAAALSRFSRTKQLDVQMPRRPDGLSAELMDQYAAAANQLIKAAACMRQLEQLNLHLMCHDERICLGPLTSLASLRTLSIRAFLLRSAAFSDEQVAALRVMHSLERFDHNFPDCNAILRSLLQPPTPPFRWKWARVASGSEDLLPLLLSLPSLTEISEACVPDVAVAYPPPDSSQFRRRRWGWG